MAITKMTSKVGTKGQVVIPKRIRESRGINAGDDVVVAERDGQIVIEPLPRSGELLGMLAGPGPSLTAALEEERKLERELEERKYSRLFGSEK